MKNDNVAARLVVECLEPREVPASLVVATLAGSMLTLTGGEEADVFTIRDDGAGVSVFAGGSTQIIYKSNIGNPTITQPVNAIRVFGKGGSDTVTLDGSTAATLSGAFWADLGDGDNAFSFIPTVAGNTFGSFTYKGQAGSDHIHFGSFGAAATTVAGAFSAATGENNGGQALGLFGVTLKGPLTYAAKDGYDVVQADFVVAEKAVTIGLGDGSIGATSAFVSQDSVFKGNVTVTAGDYNELVQFSGTTTMAGKAGLVVKGGDSGVTTVTAADLTLSAGGISVVAKNGTSDFNTSFPLSAAGPVTVSNRVATLTTTGTVTTGPVTVAGADSAQLTLGGHSTVNGKVSSLSAAGTAYVSLSGAAADYDLNGSVVITGATTAGFYESTTGVIDVAAGVAITSKHGATTADVNDATFNGGLALTAAVGAATLTVNTLGLTVNGPTAVSGFASATITDTATASVYNGNVGVTSGNGTAVLFKPSAGAITVNGTTTVAGHDYGQIYLAATGPRTFGKDVAVRSRVGIAYLLAVPDANATATAQTLFKGNVAVSGFGTDLQLTSDNASSVAGNLTVAGAGGTDTVVWNSGFNVLGNATITTGKGATAIDIGAAADPQTAVKNLSVTTGTAADVIEIYNVKVNGTTTINTGAGNDTLYFGAMSVFAGAVAVDMGGNEDVLLIAYETGMAAPTTFAAKSTFKLGAGNDTLYLGRAEAAGGDADSKTVFVVSGNLIDGGTGTNTFDNEAGQFDDDLKVNSLNFTDPT